MTFLRPSHFAGTALLLAVVLSHGSANAELELAQSGDIVVATTSVNETGMTALLVSAASRHRRLVLTHGMRCMYGAGAAYHTPYIYSMHARMYVQPASLAACPA